MPTATAKLKWLLLADIHFKHQDLDRIKQTAAWIVSVAIRHRVHRVVVCGDLLTSRSSQPTHVLSACYRFLASLTQDARVRHVNVVLGNHDLAYRRDYTTTALDALRLAAPTVQLHQEVGTHMWDGRRVLTLPFREDQSELTDAVAALDPHEAAETVAFAHLALHKAITQRHVVRPTSDAASRRTGSVAYHGMIGPDYFSSLARTFTGHFHSHQTIFQPHPHPHPQPPLLKTTDPSTPGRPDELEAARLRGSVMYLGSPLQLTWADLWDERRGVVLLDPETLHHDLIVNPIAVGYTTAGIEEVLSDAVDPAAIQGKHVMLLGDITRYRYALARDKLVSLGARNIRSWSPMAPRFQDTAALQGLGASAPASDATLVQQRHAERDDEMDEVGTDEQATTPPDATDSEMDPCPPQPESEPRKIDIQEQAARYVESLDLDKSLEGSRELLVQVGQRLLEAATIEQAEEESELLGGGQPNILGYKDIMPSRHTDEAGPAASLVGTTTSINLKAPNVFNARPCSLTITNFLGIQSTVHLQFGTDIEEGLTFLVGENGAGKSTIVEAIVWCQFGKCLRSGLSANDVVNDKAKKDCSVRMVFNNGYTITRYRKHKQYGIRTIVERDGNVLPELDKADARSTQAVIDDLLGVDYDTFIKTVVLGHESTTSFLSSTPAQRRDLILSVLGLKVLDSFADITRRMLREIAGGMSDLQSKWNTLQEKMEENQKRIKELVNKRECLQEELMQIGIQRHNVLIDAKTLTGHISKAQLQVDGLLQDNKLADIRRSFDKIRSAIQDQRLVALRSLVELQDKHSRLLSTKPNTDTYSAARPQGYIAAVFNWLLDRSSNIQRRLQSVGDSLDFYPSATTPRIAKRAVGALLIASRRVFVILRRLSGTDAWEKAKARMEQEIEAYRLSLEDVEADIEERSWQLPHFENLMSDEHIIGQIATERCISERFVRESLDKVAAADDAEAISTQLDTALTARDDLRTQEKVHNHELARLEGLQTGKKSMYKEATENIETESKLRRDLKADRDVYQEEIMALARYRDLVQFWASALAQKSSRVSSSPATAPNTFREFIVEQSLTELNTATSQILAILFEHNRHANALTTGMLRSLFIGDRSDDELKTATMMMEEGDGGEARDSGQDHPSAGGGGGGGGALDGSLSVGSRLSYGKRSGGERKRVDLALYFALLYVNHARSPHRAHYLIVDEVFDSLDAAGQAAVVKWCDFMGATRIAYIIVITHSEHLRLQEGGSNRAVIVAKMGKAGVELEKDGLRIG